MAFNGLVTGECGGANPLMKLANQVHSQNHTEQNYDQYQRAQKQVRGNVSVPQTFDMQCLLDEMQDLQRPAGMSNIDHAHIAAKDWQKEFMHQNQLKIQQKIEVPIIMDQHRERNILSPSTPATAIQPLYTPSMLRQHQIPSPQIMNNQNWAHNFLDESLKQLENADTTEKTGKEILESLEANDEEEIVDKWVEELKSSDEGKRTEEDVDEYLNSIPDVTESDIEYWEKLQKDFNELFHEDHLLNNEETNLNTYKEKEYQFEESNPFTGYINAFEEGIKKLEAGDLISAILLFEEAVTQKPDHAEAWQYLGTSQAENEQEMLSIKALKKCVELQPDNLEAWMSLSVSYTNESMYFQACESLKSWLKNNPKYSHLLPTIATSPTDASKSNAFTSSLISLDALKQIENLYLSAARISPGMVDSEIQIGLGILFNISHEYDKAIDCFRTGLKINPQSATLWNKLGATLANSGKSAEAIEAYRNALSLRPGFIRCRYNLGISCINLKVYGTAIEHFLTALNMQRQGEDPTRTASTMSENVWDTLRMTISLHGRLDLLPLVEARNLKRLNMEFQGTKSFS